MNELKKIPLKILRQYYKRFALGEQYIKINSRLTGKPSVEILKEEKEYYWQEQRVYNHVLPIINSLGQDLAEDDLYGKNGLVALLEPYQRDYNRIMNLHNLHLEFATLGILMVEDGSVDVDDLEDDGLAPGKIIVYRQGSTIPNLKKDTLNTRPYLESAECLLKTMYDIAGSFCHCQSQKGKKPSKTIS
jgi:hypothetical protein